MQALENRKGRTLTGIVVSDKNDKTIVVRVETLVKHPLQEVCEAPQKVHGS